MISEQQEMRLKRWLDRFDTPSMRVKGGLCILIVLNVTLVAGLVAAALQAYDHDTVALVLVLMMLAAAGYAFGYGWLLSGHSAIERKHRAAIEECAEVESVLEMQLDYEDTWNSHLIWLRQLIERVREELGGPQAAMYGRLTGLLAKLRDVRESGDRDDLRMEELLSALMEFTDAFQRYPQPADQDSDYDPDVEYEKLVEAHRKLQAQADEAATLLP